jgi:small-conductance mechanosensitive channel
LEIAIEELSAFLNTVLLDLGGQQLTVGQLILAPVVVIIGFLLARWAEKLLSRRLAATNTNPDLVHFTRRAFYVLVIVLLVFTALDLLNVPLGAFAFVSGAIAIGVGFGAQNIINNFISGWILMWERPIRIGDFLEIGETRGTVEAINTRSTRIKRVDGVHLLVPNSQLLENTVVNWTLVDRRMRAMVRVGVSYGSPVQTVRALLEQTVQSNPDVMESPEPLVFFEDFGDSALVFDVYFWIDASAERDLRKVRSDLRFAITEAFEANDIVIAFPQRDVHIDGAIEVIRRPDA